MNNTSKYYQRLMDIQSNVSAMRKATLFMIMRDLVDEAAQDAKPVWTKVEDGLPQSAGWYQTFWSDESNETFYFEDDCEEDDPWGENFYNANITHWTYLPEGPKL